MPKAGLDIGRQIDQFVEQNAGLRQHPLDLVGRIRNRLAPRCRCVSSHRAGGW